MRARRAHNRQRAQERGAVAVQGRCAQTTIAFTVSKCRHRDKRSSEGENLSREGAVMTDATARRNFALTVDA